MSAARIPRTVPERKPRAGVISNSHGKGGKSSLTVQTSRAKQSNPRGIDCALSSEDNDWCNGSSHAIDHEGGREALTTVTSS
jgi:hypothetical protein